MCYRAMQHHFLVIWAVWPWNLWKYGPDDIFFQKIIFGGYPLNKIQNFFFKIFPEIYWIKKVFTLLSLKLIILTQMDKMWILTKFWTPSCILKEHFFLWGLRTKLSLFSVHIHYFQPIKTVQTWKCPKKWFWPPYSPLLLLLE